MIERFCAPWIWITRGATRSNLNLPTQIRESVWMFPTIETVLCIEG